MGSSNFLIWNPTAANQENDTAYASDAQRVGGAPNGVAFPSPTGNKLFYQLSTGVAALMQMMASKGYVVSDANLSTLAGVLANILTNADLKLGLQTLAYSASLNLNCATYNGFQISLAGNTTLTISGQTPGQLVSLIFIQDVTGGRTVTFPASFKGFVQPDP